MPPVVAFDPGRNVGFALVADDGQLLEHAVVTLESIPTLAWPDDAIVVIGSGTGRDALMAALASRDVPAVVVDERGTSEHGRTLWRRTVRARGLSRWLPPGLRVPDEPIDDFAAWAIALRFLGLDETSAESSWSPSKRA